MTVERVRASRKRVDELPIRHVLRRLKKAGYSERFVRENFLPDWWDDELSADPATMAIAEIGLARWLRVSIRDMRTPDAPLTPQLNGGHRFKLQRADEDHVTAAVAVAQSAAEALAATGADLPDFVAEESAAAIRARLLARHPVINLRVLLDYAWSVGIMVAHLRLPKQMCRFAGLALLVDGQPVIMLASRWDSPPWLAFHLAHEFAHVHLGHVAPGEAHFDEKIDLQGAGERRVEENAANAFALTLLTGEASPSFAPLERYTGEQLAQEARQIERIRRIDAGTLALVYGYNVRRMGVAQNALQELGLQAGGQAQIAAALQGHLPSDLPASLRPALALMGIEADTTPCLSADF